MATVAKRGKKFAVVYYAIVNGKKKQVWESFASQKEAARRKAEVELEIEDGVYVAPNRQTVATYMDDFVKLYSEENWSISTYTSNLGVIDNYIKPMMGDELLINITPRYIDQFIKRMRSTKPVGTSHRTPKAKAVGPSVIQNVFKLLRCAFGQAVRWEILKRNPFDLVKIPKVEYNHREIWTADMIRKALDACDDSRLYIAMNLAFACSLRIGEILGLTWDCVFIDDEHIARDDAYIYVEKEMQRVYTKVLDTLNSKDVLYVFPSLLPNCKT